MALIGPFWGISFVKRCILRHQHLFCCLLATSSSSYTATTAFIPSSHSRPAAACTAHHNMQMNQHSTETDPLESLGLPSPLILGSGSFTRKLILKEMGIPFELLVRPIDERGIGDRERDDPQMLVTTLAKAKSDALVSAILNGQTDLDDPKKSRIVLTADQVVTHEGNILEKPTTVEEAKAFVSRYGSSPPKTVGACVLTHLPSKIQVCGVDTATIVFRSSVSDANQDGKDLVDRLMEDGAPVMECAGGLMVEHPLVKEHIDCIQGTEDSVMGLSKDLVRRLLEELSSSVDNHCVTTS